MALLKLLAIFCILECAYGEGFDHHWKKDKLVQLEDLTMSSTISRNLMTEKEKKVNNILMNYKKQEYDLGITEPGLFLPNWNFIEARPYIDQSPLFKILKKFPKGGNLHVHLESMCSLECLIELTHQENLYACEDEVYDWRFKFFKTPDNQCHWRLLSEIRAEDSSFDEKLRKLFSMPVYSPYDSDYSVAFSDFIKLFVRVVPIISYRPIFQIFVNQSLLEMYEDNIMYAEIRSYLFPLYDLDGTVYPPTETARILLDVLKDFHKRFPSFHGARLIYAPRRDTSIASAEQFVSIALELKAKFPDFIAGLDFSGWEDAQVPLSTFQNQINTLKKNGIPFIPIAGSSVWHGTEKDQNLFDALLLGAKRIGGAEAILRHPEMLRFIKLRGTPIEVLPISSQLYKLNNKIANHPAGYLITNGFTVVIGNKDSFNLNSVGLSHDWYEVFLGIVSRNEDLRLLKQLAYNSIEYSTMSLKEKLIAHKSWYKAYEEFLDEILKMNLMNVA